MGRRGNTAPSTITFRFVVVVGCALSNFHFAKNLPGPPVLLTIELQGKILRRMVLLERKERSRSL